MTTALVTGATSGVGRAVALALAKSGRRVLALGRDADRLDELARYKNIEPIALDIRDRDGLRQYFENAEVDILVNNAGLMPPLVAFDEMSEEAIETTIAVNFSASVRLTRIIAPGMRRRELGHIIFTGSTAGHAAFPRLAVYGATKAALAAFADGLRLDLQPYRIKVTEVVAGRTETALYKGLVTEEMRAAMYAGGTAVQPEDIAQMLIAVLDLPDHVNVSRFDISPTRQATATGAVKKEG